MERRYYGKSKTHRARERTRRWYNRTRRDRRYADAPLPSWTRLNAAIARGK